MPKWIWEIIHIVWGMTSGPMREAIVKSVKECEAKAAETKNPADDIIVGIVKWLLKID